MLRYLFLMHGFFSYYVVVGITDPISLSAHNNRTGEKTPALKIFRCRKGGPVVPVQTEPFYRTGFNMNMCRRKRHTGKVTA